MIVQIKAGGKRALAFFLLALLSTDLLAQTARGKWSISPIIGLHSPALDVLNERGFKAPVTGIGDTERPETEAEPQRDTISVPIGFDNDLEAIGTNANVGLEFQWVQSARHEFIMGGSTWEGDSSSSTNGQLPVQGNVHNVDYVRRAKISYNEFYFGWRYNFRFKETKKYRLYSRITLNELFDVDYREEHVFSIPPGGLDVDEVKRIFIVKGQTTGVLMFQFGLGGEYFLSKKMSIGMEAGYVISPQSFELSSTALESDEQLGDGFALVLPVHPRNINAPLGAIDPNTEASQNWTQLAKPVPQDMKLRFDGWKLALKFTIYY